MQPGPPAPPSYRLAAVDALSRRDADLFRLLTSKPGVGRNPVVPAVGELRVYLNFKALLWGPRRSDTIATLGPPAPPSYLFAAVDALSRGDEDVYRLLSSKPGVGPNPVVPTAEELKAYLEAKNPSWGFKRSALHVCCGLGLRKSVEVVMESGEVEVDCVDDHEATPLFHASLYDHSDIVGLLVEGYGADVNREKRWIGSEMRPTLDESNPLFVAAEAGHLVMVRKLLSLGADPSYRRKHCQGYRDDPSVLEVACLKGHTAVVRTLLSAGADPNSHRSFFRGQRHNPSVLTLATVEDRPSMVSLLLEYGADPQYRQSYWRGDPHNATELHNACERDRVQCVRLLWDAGADVSARMTRRYRRRQCWVPLGVAAYHGHLGAVAVLLSVGADPFEADANERVPLIDCRPHTPSVCVLMDSRPSCV